MGLPHKSTSECFQAGAEVGVGVAVGCMRMPGGSFACTWGSRTPRTQQTQIMSGPHTLGWGEQGGRPGIDYYCSHAHLS